MCMMSIMKVDLCLINNQLLLLWLVRTSLRLVLSLIWNKTKSILSKLLLDSMNLLQRMKINKKQALVLNHQHKRFTMITSPKSTTPDLKISWILNHYKQQILWQARTSLLRPLSLIPNKTKSMLSKLSHDSMNLLQWMKINKKQTLVQNHQHKRFTRITSPKSTTPDQKTSICQNQPNLLDHQQAHIQQLHQQSKPSQTSKSRTSKYRSYRQKLSSNHRPLNQVQNHP